MLKRTGDAVATTGAYALLALVSTWPLIRGIARDVPADLGDPLLNAWILSWDAEHILRAFGGNVGALRDYWNANIFHPHPLALAYSEHLTPQALMILPVWALTRNPFLCYNLAFLATFVLSALGMYLFVRELTGSRGAAFIAGVAFGFAPYRFGTMSHVQILSSMWMPLALLGIHRFFETRRAAPLVGGAAAWTIQNLSCSYYLVFFSPILALYVACEITRRNLWRDASVLIRLAAVLALVTLATAPFVAPYMKLRQLGFGPRSLAETASFSADVYGYATAGVGLRLWGGLVRAWPKPENALFPGFAIGLLAALAMLGQWRLARQASHLKNPRTKSTQATGPATARRVAARLLGLLVVASCCIVVAVLLGWTFQLHVAGVNVRIIRIQRVLAFGLIFYAALLLLSERARQTARQWFGSSVGVLALVTMFAFAMSLGPQIHSRGRLIAKWNVYTAFYDFVPGFDGLRVPARFGMVVALGLAALAGVGAAPFARGRHGAIYVALGSAIIAAESWAAPIPLNVNLDYKQSGLTLLPQRLAWEPDIPPVYRLISGLPPSSAVIELPFGEVAFETRYMIYSISHWRRLVNGYSGGMPDKSGLWAERFKEVLDKPAAAWQAVVESQATHIVVHEASFSDGAGPRVSEWARAHGARELAAFGSDRIFSLE